MPIPITQGLLAFTKQKLEVNVWEVEVPRYDTQGVPINPSTVTTPSSWPIVTCKIDGRMTRTPYVGTDPYKEAGRILFEVHGITKASIQAAYDPIDALWASQANWWQVAFSPSGDNSNPFYVVHMLLKEWWLGQVEDERLADSQMYFRGELLFDCIAHGAIFTG